MTSNMDTPPVPKPRTAYPSESEQVKRPVPLPRTKLPANSDKVSASNILRSIGTVSKQIGEDVAQKVTSSAKTANDKIEKSIQDGSKFAKGTLEKTITTSRAVRDTVTKSVIDGTKSAGHMLRRSKRVNRNDVDDQRCASMPVFDVSFFDNIQFHSPLLEQKKYKIEDENLPGLDLPSLNLNTSQFDDLSIFSSNSDSNTETVSNFSYDSRDEHSSNMTLDNEQLTYDMPKPSRANSVVSSGSYPEVPERRKKRPESAKELMKQNSLYENWNLPFQNPDSSERPSKSTIFEFDPLNESTVTPKYAGVSNELLLLESFLTGDTYGSLIQQENCFEDNFDITESDYFNPPTPPERLDSLFTDAGSKSNTSDKDGNSNWFVSIDSQEVVNKDQEVKSNNSMMQRFSHMLKLDNGRNKTVKQNTQKVETVDRPPLNSLPVPYYSGTLTRIVSGVVEDLFKNSQQRYCVLSDQKLMCYTDATNSILKEAYTLDSIYSLQIVLPLSSSSSNNSYCFELMMSTGGLKSTPRKVLFSCGSAPERRNWAQKIAEHLTSVFPQKYNTEFTRCGWCYLKEGVTGEWRGAWVMLVRRVLVYHTRDSAVSNVDLRKTRCVVTQDADEETKQLCPSESNSILLLDCPEATLYLRFPYEKELKGWRYMIKLAAHNNGPQLHHQQLTKEDVPTIVDKCLSFIYAHGSLSVGIYRRAGSNTVLTELLARFRRDSWSVQLSPSQHSEHDVAGVLKRFFRDLPEPLIPQEKHEELVQVLGLDDESSRLAVYRRLMSAMPLVAKNTARKLFAHLHFLHTMAHVNKMNAENLASVWAPTLMPGTLTSNVLQTAWSSKEVYVVRDLIAHFESVWELTEVEKKREAAVKRVLMRVLSNSVPAAPKAAGDLRAWVYIKDRNTCHQVTLTPNKTSADVCIELCEKANIESHRLMLEEVVCNDSLRRVVHINEIVLDAVLRWGYWDEEDRKDNYLVVKENKLLQEIDALRNTTSLVCGELRFANESSKNFKLHMFEFQDSKLSYFKDKQGSHKIEEWNIKDVLWYSGYEPKRNPQSRWAITFISKNNKPRRSKERPWFGCTIAGAVTEDQLKWMTAMMFGEHSTILPTPRLVIT